MALRSTCLTLIEMTAGLASARYREALQRRGDPEKIAPAPHIEHWIASGLALAMTPRDCSAIPPFESPLAIYDFLITQPRFSIAFICPSFDLGFPTAPEPAGRRRSSVTVKLFRSFATLAITFAWLAAVIATLQDLHIDTHLTGAIVATVVAPWLLAGIWLWHPLD
jgi:hypothetical protein